MGSLISRVREISKRIKDLEGLRATEDEASQFKTRADDLSNLAGKVQQTATQIEMFRSRGIVVETAKSHAYQLRLELEAMQQAYATDRKSILGPSNEWRFSTRTGLESIARGSQQELREAWDRYLSELKPTTDTGLLRLLARSTAYKERSRRIEELGGQIDRLSNQPPNTVEDLERPLRLAKELRGLLSELPDDIPVPVSSLFQAINERRATAEQLTQETMQWLLDNEMLSDLQVSWRSN